MPEKKKKALIHKDAKSGRTVASAARSAAYFKLQAGRRATAKRLSGQTATTQAQLEARRPQPKPGGREGMIGAFLGKRGQLEGALKPKRKRKKD